MSIHWWRTDSLVVELAKGDVSERQSLWYAVVNSLLVVQATYWAEWFGGYRSWILLAEFVAVCVITVIGLQECFKANGGSNGSAFIKRFICLGVPVGIKLALAAIVLSEILSFAIPRLITEESFRNPYFVWQLLGFFFVGAFAVVYYWRIAYHMVRIANSERSNPSIQLDAR